MKRKQAPKERNPFVQHIRLKPSGAHSKSAKAQRSVDKVALKKRVFSDT